MVDLTKYNVDNDDIAFLQQIEDACVNEQNEVQLEYDGYSFVLEPHGKIIKVYSNGNDIAEYETFDNFLLNHKIAGKTVIDIIKDIEYGE